MQNNTTIRQMIQWLRDDLVRLEKKIDNLQKFRWITVGYLSAFSVIAAILVRMWF